MNNTFDNILLVGRPAAGKSEFIDCFKKADGAERANKWHIGRFEEIDDFPWLWEKFLEDDMWEAAGYERLYSHKEGHNRGLSENGWHLFDLMIVKFNHEIKERYLSRPEFYDEGTLFIEFSRGASGGFRRAFDNLDKDIFKNAAILYIDVSAEESQRRNNARYEEKQRSSILAHKATDRVMETYYRSNDWKEITDNRCDGTIDVHGIAVPFINVNNEPEIRDPALLAQRYQPALDKLWKLYSSR